MSVSILVVDDEPDVPDLFRQHFHRGGASRQVPHAFRHLRRFSSFQHLGIIHRDVSYCLI
jgi:hypothetical protein